MLASPSSATTEIRSLTGVRGIAACLVVFYHYFQDSSGLGPVHRVFAHGYIAVDLFFVLSGFVMALTYGKSFAGRFSIASYFSFLGKRLGRVYPLYIVVTLAVTGFIYLHLINGEVSSALTIVVNVVMVQAWGFAESIGGPTWSISTELAAYLAFPALVAVTLSRRTILPSLSAIAAFVTLVLLARLDAVTLKQVFGGVASRSGPLDIFGTNTVFPLLRCFVGFVLGLLAYRLHQTPAVTRLLRWRHAGDVVALVVVVLLAMRDTDVLLEVAFAALIVTLASGRSWTSFAMAAAPIFWLGEISYSIYLVHWPIESLIRNPLVAILDKHHVPHAYTVAGLMPLILTLLVSAATFYGIEKPARNWSRRLMGSRRPPIPLEPAAP